MITHRSYIAMPLVAAALVTGCSATDPTDQLRQGSTGDAASEPKYANPMNSSVSREQRGRKGADATESCRSKPVSDYLETLDSQPPWKLSVGYYTDARGLVLWGAELNGGEAALMPNYEFPDQLHSLCWFTGDFTIPASDGVAAMPASSIIVGYQQVPDYVFTLVASSPDPIGIFAPPVPENAQSAPARTAARVVHQQPAGVDELPAAPSRRDELQRELERRPDYNAG